MIPDYLNEIQKQVSYNLGKDLKITNHLYDDQINDPVTKEIYNYLIYSTLCSGYNELHAILDFRPDPVLLVPYTQNPQKVLGYQGFSMILIIPLETPHLPDLILNIHVHKTK